MKIKWGKADLSYFHKLSKEKINNGEILCTKNEHVWFEALNVHQCNLKGEICKHWQQAFKMGTAVQIQNIEESPHTHTS